jgi:DNA polymerase-3 subunit epsilon
MPIILTRPIVFFDLETTGASIKEDRIVQYCFTKVDHTGPTQSRKALVNPKIPIKEAATAIHGITDKMVQDQQPFSQHALHILHFIEGCDLAGYNSNSFDIPLLYNEFNRVGVNWDYTHVNFIDVCSIFKINEPRDLSNAYKHYTGGELKGAHDAEADVKATIEIFFQQIERHQLTVHVPELALYSNYGQVRADLNGCFVLMDGDYVLNFGKHKGEKASKCLGYISWMLDSDFPADVKAICKKVLNPLAV